MATKLSLISLKRTLIQSDIHRYMGLDGKDGSTDDSTRCKTNRLILDGARIIECSQNVTELRRLLQKWEVIEKVKKKTIRKIEGEQQQLRVKYSDLLAINSNTDPCSEDDFTSHQPGFRYKANGDIRQPGSGNNKTKLCRKCQLGRSDVLQLSNHHNVSDSTWTATTGKGAKNKEIVNPIGGSAGKVNHSNPGSDGSPKHCLEANPVVERKQSQTVEGQGVGLGLDVSKEIKEIERDLEGIKNNAEIREIQERLSKVKKTMVFLRAHSRNPTGASPTESYFTGPPSAATQRSRRDRAVVNVRSLVKRLHKACIKASCIACEFKLKQSEHDKISKGTNRPIQRWKAAPRGVYAEKPLVGLRPRSTPARQRPSDQVHNYASDKQFKEIEDKLGYTHSADFDSKLNKEFHFHEVRSTVSLMERNMSRYPDRQNQPEAAPPCNRPTKSDDFLDVCGSKKSDQNKNVWHDTLKQKSDPRIACPNQRKEDIKAGGDKRNALFDTSTENKLRESNSQVLFTDSYGYLARMTEDNYRLIMADSSISSKRVGHTLKGNVEPDLSKLSQNIVGGVYSKPPPQAASSKIKSIASLKSRLKLEAKASETKVNDFLARLVESPAYQQKKKWYPKHISKSQDIVVWKQTDPVVKQRPSTTNGDMASSCNSGAICMERPHTTVPVLTQEGDGGGVQIHASMDDLVKCRYLRLPPSMLQQHELYGYRTG